MLFSAAFLLAFVTLGSTMPKQKTWREIHPIYPEIKTPIPHISNGRIVGGSTAELHSFPHQVALFLHKPIRTNFCGGSLISAKYVMTAAHCTLDAITIDVVLGAQNIRDETEYDQLLVTTSDYVIHEDYDSTRVLNDVSIIRLPDDSVVISDIINTIPLPTWSDVGKDITDERTVLSGWGKIKDSDMSYTDYLQYVELSVITNDECDVWFFGGTIKDTHVCTSGQDGRSPCNGDSGGALVLDGKQVGIVSFGTIFGCESGFPGAYTRVTEFLQWIQDHSDIIIEA